MGIFDKVASVLIRFRVDSKDAEQGMKRLTAAEKDAAQAAVDAQKKRDTAYQAWADGISALNGAMGLYTKTIGYADKAWQAYQKSATEAGGAEAERAKKFQESLDKWNQAMQDATVAVGRMVAGMGDLVVSLANTLSLITRIGVAAQKIPGTSGGGGSGWKSYTPLDPVGFARHGLNAVTDVGDWLGSAGEIPGRYVQGDQTYGGAILGRAGRNASGYLNRAFITRLSAQVQADIEQWTELEGQNALAAYGQSFLGGFGISGTPGAGGGRKKAPRAGGGARPVDVVLVDVLANAAMKIQNPAQAAGAVGAGLGLAGLRDAGAVGALGGGQFGDLSTIRVGASAATNVAAVSASLGELASAHRRSVLEDVFGPLREWDAYAAKMELLAGAVGEFSGALQTGFDAWVSGSKTAKEAVLGALAQTVTGIAQQLFAYGVSEGVQSLIHLAGHDPVGAALHGKAAAAAAAGGVAVGAIARRINAHGSGASAGGGYGGGAPAVGGAYGGGSGPQPTVTNVYVGDGFQSERWRRQELERTVALARRATGDESSSVRWS